MRKSWERLAMFRKVSIETFITNSIKGAKADFLPPWLNEDGSLSEVAKMFQRIADNAKLNTNILSLIKEYKKLQA